MYLYTRRLKLILNTEQCTKSFFRWSLLQVFRASSTDLPRCCKSGHSPKLVNVYKFIWIHEFINSPFNGVFHGPSVDRGADQIANSWLRKMNQHFLYTWMRISISSAGVFRGFSAMQVKPTISKPHTILVALTVDFAWWDFVRPSYIYIYIYTSIYI